MRYIKWVGAAIGVIVLGSALLFFGNYYSKNSAEVASKNTKTTVNNKVTSKKGIKLTGTATQDNYKSVIKDGNYLVGKARGITASQNDNQYNTEKFENGLLNLAKNKFSPKSYIFQEGQYLDASTAKKWLDRKSNSNPDGLNPEDNGKKDDGRNPLYLQAIEEQDFMVQSSDSLQLKGIMLGLAMNSEDIYQKEEYGANYTQKIDDNTRIAKGKELAAEVVKRYRKLEGVNSNTPIVVALFTEAPSDSLTGGTFYSYTESNNGDKISGFNPVNDINVVLPMQENTFNYNEIAANLNGDFINFQNTVQGFFPNLSYITAQAQYHDKTLASLKVDVTTQFYSQTEMNSFTNYLAQTAPSMLPTDVDVQIRVKTVNGVQAVLVKKANGKSYEVIQLGTTN